MRDRELFADLLDERHLGGAFRGRLRGRSFFGLHTPPDISPSTTIGWRSRTTSAPSGSLRARVAVRALLLRARLFEHLRVEGLAAQEHVVRGQAHERLRRPVEAQQAHEGLVHHLDLAIGVLDHRGDGQKLRRARAGVR
jgi:hypothetical protein